MSDGTEVKTKGGGGKRGVGRRNNFCNNKQPNNNADSRTRNIKDLETATYIVSQFSLANIYKKLTKYIIRYVIRNIPDGVHLAHGMRNSKLPNMSLDTNLKQEKK